MIRIFGDNNTSKNPTGERNCNNAKSGVNSQKCLLNGEKYFPSKHISLCVRASTVLFLLLNIKGLNEKMKKSGDNVGNKVNDGDNVGNKVNDGDNVGNKVNDGDNVGNKVNDGDNRR